MAATGESSPMDLEATAKGRMGIRRSCLQPGLAAGHAHAWAARVSKRGRTRNRSLARGLWAGGAARRLCASTAPADTGKGRISASPEDSQWPENVTEGFGTL